MKSYNFLANVMNQVRGYVAAESEEEAIQKIKDAQFDDIMDEDPIGDYENIVIIGYDDLEDYD